MSKKPRKGPSGKDYKMANCFLLIIGVRGNHWNLSREVTWSDLNFRKIIMAAVWRIDWGGDELETEKPFCW